MGFVKEFKEFAMKGNVVDLAVGVIIGAAFGKIVDSIVNDLIMPVVGIFFSADFSNMYYVLKGDVPAGTALADARKIAGADILAYGNFITIVINFLILALIIFLMIRAMNKMKRKHEEAAPPPAGPSSTDKLLMEIRDQLKK